MKRLTLLVSNVLLLAALVFLTMASDCRRQPPPPPPKPEIKSFSAQPGTICTNLGLPLVTLAWEVSSPSKDTCMTIESTSGKSVLSGGSGPSTPVEGGRCGRDTWTRSMRVNVTELYGTNAPQSITFTGRLDEEAIGGQTGIDTKSASVTTKSDCTAPYQPGS